VPVRSKREVGGGTRKLARELSQSISKQPLWQSNTDKSGRHPSHSQSLILPPKRKESWTKLKEGLAMNWKKDQKKKENKLPESVIQLGKCHFDREREEGVSTEGKAVARGGEGGTTQNHDCFSDGNWMVGLTKVVGVTPKQSWGGKSQRSRGGRSFKTLMRSTITIQGYRQYEEEAELDKSSRIGPTNHIHWNDNLRWSQQEIGRSGGGESEGVQGMGQLVEGAIRGNTWLGKP